MIAIVSFFIFAGALVTSVAVIVAMVGPQWRRIVRLASGEVETRLMPLATLSVAEDRIAVRRWASPSALAISPWRAAA